LTKRFLPGRRRIEAIFDVYNIFNERTITASNGTYGAAWLTPTSILGSRLFKFGVQVNY